MNFTVDSVVGTRVVATGPTVISSGRAAVVGIAFHGTATGGLQLFAGVTASASYTPMITFCATSSAVAGGFSPQFLRFPLMCSGSGLTALSLDSADMNLTLFWVPITTP